MVLGQEVSELLVWRLLEHCLLPQIGSKVGVCGSDCGIGSLSEVTKSTSGTLSRGVAIFNTSHLEQLLGNGSGDNASSTGGWDESHPDGATLSSHLAGDGVGLTHVGTPEPTPDRNDTELGSDDGTTDSGSNLLGALYAKTNMTIVVTNG